MFWHGSNRTEPEIAVWSEYRARRSPSDKEGCDFYNESVQKIAAYRDDLVYLVPIYSISTATRASAGKFDKFYSAKPNLSKRRKEGGALLDPDRDPRNQLGPVRWGKIKESRKNYFDSGLSLSRSGVEGATEVEESEETADAAGVVGDGAVADSIVVVEGASVEDRSEVECPNIFDRNLANIPITDTTPSSSQSPTAPPLSNFYRIQR